MGVNVFCSCLGGGKAKQSIEKTEKGYIMVINGVNCKSKLETQL